MLQRFTVNTVKNCSLIIHFCLDIRIIITIVYWYSVLFSSKSLTDKNHQKLDFGGMNTTSLLNKKSK